MPPRRPTTLPVRPPIVPGVNVHAWQDYNRWWQHHHRPWWHTPANWSRPWYANRPAWYWGRPWYWYHWHWHQGYWAYWRTPPTIWFGTSVSGWLVGPADAFVYYNPYFVQPVVGLQPALNYSLPIPAPSVEQSGAAFPPDPTLMEDGTLEKLPTTAPPAPSVGDTAAKEANRLFDSAREAFRKGDYARAQELADQAITWLPSDAALHEFRALTLFAQGKYREASAALYAVLAAGPGWNWQTMSALYPDVATYTRQLRALEQHVRQNPTDGSAHFLVAYHYLVHGSKDAAVGQLKEVVRLVPKDKLAAALLNALTSGEVSGAPSPGVVK